MDQSIFFNDNGNKRADIGSVSSADLCVIITAVVYLQTLPLIVTRHGRLSMVAPIFRLVASLLFIAYIILKQETRLNGINVRFRRQSSSVDI